MFATLRSSPAIPLSPSSPPAHGIKQRSKSHFPQYALRSPTSPPLMSIATKSYASSFANTQSSSGPPASQQSPSPPTSASTYTQESHLVNMNNANELLTPAESRLGLSRAVTTDDQDQHHDKRQKVGPTENKEDRMDLDMEFNAMDHDRQDNAMGGASEHVFETSDNYGESSGLHPAPGNDQLPSDEVSLKQLQKDMGEVFLLCRSTLPRSQPNPSQHLLALYGLSPLHATVARTDPRTGEKINKLRKSYEGQIKSFGLAGRNKPVKLDIPEGEKGKLRSLVEDMPDEEWNVQGAKKIEVTPDFNALLQKAMKMRPGTVRNHAMWEDALGHEKSRPAPVPEAMPKILSSATTHVRQTNGIARPQGQAATDVVRPRRTGKKRSYADDSFEGYGDGYVDDDGDMDQGAYSNSEDGEHGPGRKKRKKEHAFSASPTTYDRPSYGIGGYVGNQ